MKPGISEFSYGYAVTNEVLKFLGTSIAAALGPWGLVVFFSTGLAREASAISWTLRSL
jgi:hypothetical protein